VLPDNVTAEREALLRAFGAEVVYAENATSTNDAVFKAQRMLAADPGTYFMPYQYGNENNPRAHYETTGPEILRDLPETDVFVAGLGTGGTLTGCGRYLKENRTRATSCRGCAPSKKGSSRRCSTSLCWTGASSSIPSPLSGWRKK
jgi:cysteine synthase B